MIYARIFIPLLRYFFVPAAISARIDAINPPKHIPQCIPKTRLKREMMVPIMESAPLFGTFASSNKNTGPDNRAAPI